MWRGRLWPTFLCVLLLVSGPTTTLVAQSDGDAVDATAIIEARVGQLANGADVKVAGQSIASRIVIEDLYSRRSFHPAWTDGHDLDALVEAVRTSEGDGLDPSDYHQAALERLREAPASPQRDADLDMLATDAAVRLAYHLRFGKVDVSRIDRNWNFRADYETALTVAPALYLQEALDADRFAETLDAYRPAHAIYSGLRGALARYRAIAENGGWRAIPAGPPLKPGEFDARVPPLRIRLAAEGDLERPSAATGATYTNDLVEAVQRFQQRHGLTADGVVGPSTARALNVSVADRINQLRLSLERGRLVLHELPPRFVVVNIPGFRVYYVDDKVLRFDASVIVGKPYTKTPVFRAEINQVVVNPTWTIPPGIMSRDVVPGMQQDPDYLQKKGFRQVGDQVVQPPGPNNALGRIKINFPNPHLVYLHDTPQRDLFDEDRRAFSSGCIRVQNVVDLAALLLDDPKWGRPQLEAAIAAERTQYISLARRVPVFLLYWTAEVRPGDDRVYFFDDVYKRDAAELAALDGPFRFSREAVRQAGTGGAGLLR